MTPATVEIRPNVTSGKTSAPVTLTPSALSPSQRPPLFISRDELFFWSREWQEGERESAEARAAGELKVFPSASEAIEWLKAPED